ncbi:ATP-binding protein [Carboxylicivirga sp. RSCT41]|uniref:ATP-binding protein n=1 Tax=Carboxylicivirga agarovorans TaxID=3417570 RepID=UPI003D329E7A
MRCSYLIVLLLVLLCHSPLASQYKVFLSNNYPPYNFVNEEGELVGFNVEIVEAINELYNADFTIKSGDWQKINVDLNNGKIDAIAGIHYNNRADSRFIYTRSAINTSHCFLYNSEHQKQFTLEKFRSLKSPLVAMYKNDVLIHYVKSINPTAELIFINSYQDLADTLENEAMTCVFAQRVGFMYFANLKENNHIRALDQQILERQLGFMVSKDSPELAAMLNNGLEVILANGTYQEIYDRWITPYTARDNHWNRYLKYIVFGTGLMLLLFVFQIIINRILRARINSKTRDLQMQLEVNAEVMKELENQKNKAEESDRMKTAFLANMSHEIRTPMHGIIGFTELLKTGGYSSEEHKLFVDIIEQSGNRMLDTINNIIDISKLDAEQETVQYSLVDIDLLMQEYKNFFLQEAAKKGIDLILKPMDNHSSTAFYTDEYKLNSILTNLIKNAIKFTTQGCVSVSYKVLNDMAEFKIEDTGIGIAKSKQAKIFEQFVQADTSYSREYEGSGLGLSITKGYIDLLGGEITLHSTPEAGTVFNVKIPQAPDFNV